MHVTEHVRLKSTTESEITQSSRLKRMSNLRASWLEIFAVSYDSITTRAVPYVGFFFSVKLESCFMV